MPFRDEGEFGVLRWQCVGLAIVGELKAMFQLAQKLICVRKPRIFRVGEKAFVTETR